MAVYKEREHSVPANHPILDNVTHNMPAAAPITRSLSKSTPRDPSSKHPPPPRAQVKDRAEDDISVQPSAQPQSLETTHPEEPAFLPAHHNKESSCSPIEQLPTEILDAIIGHVGGQLGAASLSGRPERVRNWNAILRHPRRKVISDLALVSPDWRRHVQERTFRHIKIPGTQRALMDLGNFFSNHSHLMPHVRHLQVIVPIWETKDVATSHRYIPDVGCIDSTGTVILASTAGYRGLLHHQQPDGTQSFRLASKTATLSELFACAQMLFPELYAMTIEAGHCKNPPQVRYFPLQGVGARHDTIVASQSVQSSSSSSKPVFQIPTLPGPFLPALPSVRVIILKGAWNVIRQPSDLATMTAALPNLQEFQTSYHSPKAEAYTTMCSSLYARHFPPTLRHLDICLESLYSTKDNFSLEKWRTVYPAHHMCRAIGFLAPQLESLSYTGRICGSAFSTAIKEAEKLRLGTTRLKRLDIIIRNICRDVHATNDGTGIHNMSFLHGYEILLTQAMRALTTYPELNFIRIRFIDLDAPHPLMSPCFHLEGDRAWGFWSDEICQLLFKARPGVRFLSRDGFGGYFGRTCEPEEGKRSFSVDFYEGMAVAGGHF